jgi:hypothetical protein
MRRGKPAQLFRSRTSLLFTRNAKRRHKDICVAHAGRGTGGAQDARNGRGADAQLFPDFTCSQPFEIHLSHFGPVHYQTRTPADTARPARLCPQNASDLPCSPGNRAQDSKKPPPASHRDFKIIILLNPNHFLFSPSSIPPASMLLSSREGSMSTTKQIDANRQNAQRSTGPRSPAGKAASRFNALKSGIDAQAQIMPSEDPAQLETLAAEYRQRFDASAPECRMLVDTLIDCERTLRRLARAQPALWFHLARRSESEDMHPVPAEGRILFHGDKIFDRLQHRLNSVHRIYHSALKELQRPEDDAATQPSEVLAPPPEPPEIEVPDPAQPPSNQQPVIQIGFVPQFVVGQALPSANPAPTAADRPSRATLQPESNRQPVSQIGFVPQSVVGQALPPANPAPTAADRPSEAHPQPPSNQQPVCQTGFVPQSVVGQALPPADSTPVAPLPRSESPRRSTRAPSRSSCAPRQRFEEVEMALSAYRPAEVPVTVILTFLNSPVSSNEPMPTLPVPRLTSVACNAGTAWPSTVTWTTPVLASCVSLT